MSKLRPESYLERAFSSFRDGGGGDMLFEAYGVIL